MWMWWQASLFACSGQVAVANQHCSASLLDWNHQVADRSQPMGELYMVPVLIACCSFRKPRCFPGWMSSIMSSLDCGRQACDQKTGHLPLGVTSSWYI